MISNTYSAGTIDDDLAILVTSDAGNSEHPVRIDPYPFYDRLRETAPVFRSRELGLSVVTSYAETQALVRDTRWTRASSADYTQATEAQQAFRKGFAFQDPPEHTRLRGICAAVFTPRAVEAQRESADRISRELLNEVRERDSFDFLHDFAYPAPQRLISDMLGIPPTERDSFVRWSTDLSQVNEPRTAKRADAGTARASSDEMMAFFRDLFRHKRANPSDDMVSSLLELGESQPERISDEEVMSTVVMLYQGGFSTTTNLITNMMYTLTQNPDAYRDLRREPALVPSAVEETLRYESPARNTLVRTAGETIDLGNERFETGEQVIAILGAANRDPAVFEMPHKYDIRRSPNPRQIAFSGGIHVCVGASLARIEVQEAFNQIVAEHPELSLDTEEVVWQDSFAHRRVLSLPVKWARP